MEPTDELQRRVQAAKGDFRRALDAAIAELAPTDAECGVILIALLRQRGLLPY